MYALIWTKPETLPLDGNIERSINGNGIFPHTKLKVLVVDAIS